VHDRARRAVQDLEPALPHLEAQVEILVALEVVLVEAADLFEQVPPDQDAAADVDLGLARFVIRGGGIVAPGVGVGVDRRLEIGAGVEGVARRVHQLASDDAGRGRAALHLDERPQPVAERHRVVVDEHQVFPVRLSSGEVVAACETVVDGLLDEPRLRIRADRVLDARLRGVVVEHDHFVVVDERVLG
jgi:hypothetical protein